MEKQLHRITILALDGAAATSITGPLDVFSLPDVSRNSVASKEASAGFTVQVASPHAKTVRCANDFLVTPNCAMAEVRNSDLIIIPAIFAQEESDRNHEAVLAWLHDLYAKGAQIAALCSGTFLLAATGLLDGEEATTHWSQAEKFRQLYPKVLLRPEQRLTDAGGLYCASAMHACIDLPLYLIGKFAGPGMQETCAKALGQHISSPVLPPPPLPSIIRDIAGQTCRHGHKKGAAFAGAAICT